MREGDVDHGFSGGMEEFVVFAELRDQLSQAKVRSTIHRLGSTWNLCNSLRLTTSTLYPNISWAQPISLSV